MAQVRGVRDVWLTSFLVMNYPNAL